MLKVIARVMLPFAIGSKIFPFEAHVIQDLTSDVILGRNFFEKFCAKIDFDEGMICLLYTSPSPRDLSTSRMPSSA